MEKIDKYIKLAPALTVLCYLCGFIVYNTHLMQYGIKDIELFSLNYISAGLHYLFIASLILIPNLYFSYNDEKKHLASLKNEDSKIDNNEKQRKKPLFFRVIAFIYLFGHVLFRPFLTTLVIFNFYYIFILDNTMDISVFKSILVIFLFSVLTLPMYSHLIKGKIDLGDLPNYIFVVILGSLFFFGTSFKLVRTTTGGGASYKKILVLDKPLGNIIETNEHLETDTLTILHENADYIYFKTGEGVNSLKKSYVIGEKMVLKVTKFPF